MPVDRLERPPLNSRSSPAPRSPPSGAGLYCTATCSHAQPTAGAVVLNACDETFTSRHRRRRLVALAVLPAAAAAKLTEIGKAARRATPACPPSPASRSAARPATRPRSAPSAALTSSRATADRRLDDLAGQAGQEADQVLQRQPRRPVAPRGSPSCGPGTQAALPRRRPGRAAQKLSRTSARPCSSR